MAFGIVLLTTLISVPLAGLMVYAGLGGTAILLLWIGTVVFSLGLMLIKCIWLARREQVGQDG